MHWKDWCWSWNSNTLATWCEELTHLRRPWCWERLKAGGEGDDREWDGWMASLTQWTWVWTSSGSWWWTGRSGVLQPWGRRVRHDWATQLNSLCWTLGVCALSVRYTDFCVNVEEWWKEIILWTIYYRYRQLFGYMLVLSVSRSVCQILCDPTDCSPPGFAAHGILLTGILE